MGRAHGGNRRALASFALCLLVVLAATPAGADDNPLERAMKLRNEAAADWNKKKHTDAAAKLRTALEIYATVDGEKPLDRAITLRALIWNLVRAGDTKGAQTSFEALMDLVRADEALSPEMDSAWSALWEAASATPTFDAGRKLLDAVRDAAIQRVHMALAAQIVHSTGSLARKHKETATAASLFAEAVILRRAIGDATGEVWSLNNLANLHLLNGGLKKSLPRLKEAYVLMHGERVAAPQQAIAWNLKKAIELLAAAPDKAGIDWLRALSKVGATSGFGAVVPPSHLDRHALDLAERIGKPTTVMKTGTAIVKQKSRSGVPELAADLTIRAARAAYRAGKAKQALAWLKKLDVGSGPCRPHLEARKQTAQAIASSGDKRAKKKFPELANAAASAWRTLGDFRGRIDALNAIVLAARSAGLESTIAALVKESEDAARQGTPGGAGGSASGGGDTSKVRDLPLDGAVFRITMDGAEIRIEDTVTKRTSKRAVSWKPARIGINGLVLLLFGGYVVVESLNYGGAASANAAPGQTTLDQLGIYMPIPAKGALVIQKNGALRYETATVSPR